MYKNINIDKYEDFILALFNDGKNCTEIKEELEKMLDYEYSISASRISNFIKNKLNIDSVRGINSSNYDDVCNLYLNGASIDEIADKYNSSYRLVKKTLLNNEIEIKCRNHGKHKSYNINERFFEIIDSPNKAYYLGFIIADGCIVEKVNSKKLTINIHKKDDYILKKLSICIGGKESFVKYSRAREHCILTIGSLELCNDLEMYGVVPRKTFKEKYPDCINDNFNKHIIRGFFDGDGTVFIREDKSKKYNKRLEFGFCGNYNMLLKIKEILIKDINISDNKIVKRKNGICQLMFSKYDDICNFYNYIYDNEKEYYLHRKKEIFENFINLYGSTEIT